MTENYPHILHHKTGGWVLADHKGVKKNIVTYNEIIHLVVIKFLKDVRAKIFLR